MRITTDKSNLMMMALDELGLEYFIVNEVLYFNLPDDQEIPREVSNVMQLIEYQID